MKKYILLFSLMFIHQYNIIYSQEQLAQKTIFELNWGSKLNEVGIIPEDVDDSLAGGGPINLKVDEKNGFVYIFDIVNNFRILRFDFKGNANGVITKEKYGDITGTLFNIDKNGNVYICGMNKTGKYVIIVFDSLGNKIKTITLKENTINMQEMYLDEQDNIWIGYYYGETFKINANGELLSKYTKDKLGIARSKGEYFLKDLSLYNANGKIISKFPASTILIGIDGDNNCYLNVFESSEKKHYIWKVNPKGSVIKKIKLDFEIYDQDNFLEICITKKGDIYAIPISGINCGFKIIEIIGNRS